MAGAAELFVNVGADVSDAVGQLNTLEGHVTKIGNSMNTTATGGTGVLGKLGGALGGLINPATLAVAGVAAVGAAFGDVVGAAGGFDQKMAAVKATMGGTDEEMGKLRQLALDLGSATDVGSVSAQDAADAIFELGKAGVTADQQTAGFTKSVLQLAAAAGPEYGVANAASLASDAMLTFKMSASDSTSIVNSLVGAANASSIGLSDLQFSLAAVGPVAAQMGMSLDDTAKAMAIFGQNGLKGSDAGTSFKTMMLGLNPTTEKGFSLMQELGIITADGANRLFDASGKVKSLNDISQIFKETLGQLNPEQQAYYSKLIFGTDAVRAVAILTGQGAEGVQKMGDAMKTQGDAAKTAGDMSNNFNGKMEALGGTIDTIKITIGSFFLPILSKLVDGFNALLGGALANAPGFFNQLGAAVQRVANFFAPVTGLVQNFVGAIQSGQSPITSYMDLLGNLGGFLSDLGGKVMQAVGDALPGIIDQIGKWASAFIDWIGPQIPPMLERLGEFVANMIGWLYTTALPNLLDALGTWAKAFIDWIGPQLPGMLANLGVFLKNVVEWIFGTALPALVSNLVTWGKAFVEWIAPRIGPMLVELGKVLFEIGKWIITVALPAIVKQLIDWGGAFVNWVAKDVLPKLPGALKTILDKIGDWVKGALSWIGTKLKEVGSAIVEGIKNGIKNAWDAFVNWVMGLMGSIVDAIKKFLGISSPSTVFAEMGENMALGMAAGIAKGMGAVNAAWGGLAGGGGGTFGGSISVTHTGGGPVASGRGGGAPIYLDGQLVSAGLYTRQRSTQPIPGVVYVG